MVKKLRPLASNVLVKRIKQEAITAGGIHVPENSQNKTQAGSVVAVGEGKRLEDGTICATKIKVGDVVVFGKYVGTEVELDGQELLILKEDDLLGVIESSI